MSLVRLNNLGMAFGGQEVFRALNARIDAGDHIGLVGRNGTGKTTLLRLIIGEIQPLEGHIAASPGLKIGYLPQHEEYPPGQTVFSTVYAGLGELHRVERELRRCETAVDKSVRTGGEESERNAMRYAELLDRFQVLGGSTAEARIAELLRGLAVPERIWHNEMSTLSGGERNLVGLARILIGDHDLMLLDEPGNHLDFSGLEWLENFLGTHRKAFVIVSHNRYTLDRVCNCIWELDRGRLDEYTGNYSEYRARKLSKQLAQEARYRRAQKEIERLKFNIQRLKAWSLVYPESVNNV